MLLNIIILLIKIAYVICSSVLFLYGLNSLILSILYLYKRREIWSEQQLPSNKKWPIVSIQLPIYNEGKVVEGLLSSITKIDYPRSKLQIQVLNDSSDSTSELLQDLVKKYHKKGYWIEYQHRADRTGYKAGNLESGLKTAKGEFIVIFDADYEPEADFLRKTIPYFADEQVAFVQTRWTNKNLSTNLITYLGGIAYDGHLFVEQNARYRNGLWMGFSGTAGVWRKSTLVSIGGWKWDSVTEDIEITFRSQLRGWKGVYVPESFSSMELPQDMDSYQLQQNRWAKGSAQCFKLFIIKVIKAKLPFKRKLMAVLHLLSYVTMPCLPVLLMLVLPICLLSPEFIQLFWWMALGSIGPALVFGISQLEQKERIIDRLIHLPLVSLMAVGISMDAMLGVVAGLLQKGGEFIRTPRNIDKEVDKEKERKKPLLSYLTAAEICLGIYLIATVYILWDTNGKLLAPWLLSSAMGFIFMAGFKISRSIMSA